MDDTDRLRGLDIVRVSKEKLVEIVTKNREDHRSIFGEAITNWEKAVLKALQEAVEDANTRKEFRVTFGLIRPENHTSDYDRILKMLDLSLDDELELTQAEFANYVMDDWGWQRQFLNTSSMYVHSVSNKKKISGKFS